MKRKKKRAAAAPAEEAEVAAPRRLRKRRRAAAPAAAAEEPEESDAEEAEEEEEEEELGNGETLIDMEWDFREMDESDYHAVKDLLRTPDTWEFVGDSLNFSELTDSVVNQGNIGNLIQSSSSMYKDNDPTSGGILTILNLRQFAHLSWPKAIQNALLKQASKHGGPEVSKGLKDLLGRQGKDTEVGLILSERFVNLPEELVPPLHKALKEDIEWSCTTPECPKDEKPFYFFTHLIGVAKCFMSSKKAAAAGLTVTGGEGPFFQLDEVEAYAKKASWIFTFPTRAKGEESDAAPMRGKKGTGPPAPDGRAVFMITRKALDQVVKTLNKGA